MPKSSTTARRRRSQATPPWVEASAPGRLDVMGGIADYSGSLVLEMPIAERTRVRLRLRSDSRVRVTSAAAGGRLRAATVELDLRELLLPAFPAARRTKPTRQLKNAPAKPSPETAPYARARQRLAATPGGDWAAYVIGCFLVLHHERGWPLQGADVEIDSAVPVGKGVSSSAALEVATLCALTRATGLKLGPTELPILAQRVENHVVGAPCGLMDQLASYLGRRDRLLPILCQPDRVGEPVPIPAGVHFVGIDSGVRHAVSGASYGDVRCAAFMGYSLIALQAGATRAQLVEARDRNHAAGLPFGGYLANLTPSLYLQKYRRQLPAQMTGAQFGRQAGVVIDRLSLPAAKRRYAVEACTAHPIHECERVKNFGRLLRALARTSPGRTQSTGRAPANQAERTEYLCALGELMFQSHASYGACGLGEPETDRLVEAVRAAGPARGVYGAKITGGGSGGTVCVLCDGESGRATAKRIAAEAGRRTGRRPVLFLNSSEGAHYRP